MSIIVNAQITPGKIDQNNLQKIKSIDENFIEKINYAEIALNSNSGIIKSNTKLLTFDLNNDISTLNISDAKKEKLKNLVCVSCYSDALNEQISLRNKYLFNEKINQKYKDSLAKVKLENYNKELQIKKQKELEKQIAYEKFQDSVRNSVSNENPYDVLKRSLYAFSKNPHRTVFRKMDYNFAGVNLQLYMQDDFGMAFLKDYKMTNTEIIEKYASKASSKAENITVKYNVTYRTDIEGYYPSDGVYYINSVVFTGTNNEIVNLFLKFWSGKIDFKGYKSGVIATKQMLGDFISLIGENGKYKITITKGNMDVNYDTTYGINKKK